MLYRNMTVEELERLAYIEPNNLAVQQAYAARCIEETDHWRSEAALLDDKVSELQSDVDRLELELEEAPA
jgi:ubiquinone biosynthesis protein UbiJ